MLELNESIARKVLTTVDAGLVRGMGQPKPGEMCVEAAVCYAYGLKHSDNPPCVGASVRAFKIGLNDARWSSDKARTKGLRALSIAQLGSDVIDQSEFRKLISEGLIRLVVPKAMRSAAGRQKEPHKSAMEAAAVQCELEGNPDSARAATKVARAAAAAAYAAASAAAYAAAAADAYADAYADAARDDMLSLVAEIGLQALITLKSPGCEYLYLLD
jgi:hypothetical protein